MEGSNDPFIFGGPEISNDMETLNAIHCNMMQSNGLHPNSSSIPSDAVTDWSNLQLSLNGMSSPSSSHSSYHETPMFQQEFLSHQQPQISELTSAIDGINDPPFDTISPSATDAINNTTQDLLPKVVHEQSFKPAAKMTKQNLRTLKDWKAQHGDTVKPTKQQLQRLQRRTNLSPEQIMNWFTHTKRLHDTFAVTASHRQAGALKSSSSTLTHDLSTNGSPRDYAQDRPPTPAARDILYRPATPLGDMDPMARWKNSPPEHEAALFSDIAKALTHSELPYTASKSQTSTRSASRGDSASTGSSVNGYKPEASISSIDSDLPGSTAWSDHSGQSTLSGRSTSGPSEYRRRARKRRTNPLSRGGLNSLRRDNIPKTFQCTFCTDSFKTKYDWSRHEKSLHLALESWTCSPFGSVNREADGSDPRCVYCDAPSPTGEHLNTHRYLACDGRPESERTYYRKDHLRQHLRLVHGCKFIPSMEQWKSTPEFVRSRCGFCDKNLSTWQARIDHLAGHFRSGASMANWSGGWGFEPHISRLIENGIPPFLIHQERNTVAPYSGTISCSQSKGNNLGSQEKASELEGEVSFSSGNQGKRKVYVNQYSYPATQELSWYDCLEAQLAGYIGTVLAEEGRLPSDKEIQDQGRRFVYDSDDPWHQTIAENEMWLQDFKERYAFVDPAQCQLTC